MSNAIHVRSYSIYTCLHTVLGTIVEGPSSVTYIPGLTPLPIEMRCNCTGYITWKINKLLYLLSLISIGVVPGHSHNGTNILVNSPVNNTEYICVSPSNTAALNDVCSDPAYIVIAGETLSCVRMYLYCI